MAPANPSASGMAGPAGSTRAGSAVASAWANGGAAAHGSRSAPAVNVAGMGKIRHRLGGQMMTKARPITALSGTVPPPGSPMCSRESSE